MTATQNDTTASNEKNEGPRRKFIGFSERLETARRRREAKPQPWLQRKFIVGLVVAIVGYAWYVYVGRFCLHMIRRDQNALGSLALGGTSDIAQLVNVLS